MVRSQAFREMSLVLSPAACLAIVFGGSMLALSVPLFTSSYEALLLAFCVFECLLGVYWPAIALVRSAEVCCAALCGAALCCVVLRCAALRCAGPGAPS